MKTKLQVELAKQRRPMCVLNNLRSYRCGDSVNAFRVAFIERKYSTMKPSRMKLRRKLRRDQIFSEYGWGILGGAAGQALNHHLWKKPRKITRYTINDLDLRLLSKRLFAGMKIKQL